MRSNTWLCVSSVHIVCLWIKSFTSSNRLSSSHSKSTIETNLPLYLRYYIIHIHICQKTSACTQLYKLRVSRLLLFRSPKKKKKHKAFASHVYVCLFYTLYTVLQYTNEKETRYSERSVYGRCWLYSVVRIIQ